ncbi:MAG TPA: hypothetical protein VI318_11290 [Baekduia sp.]
MRWAETQTILAVADDYEALFAEAAERASGRPVALPTAPESVEPVPEPAGQQRVVGSLPRSMRFSVPVR